MSTEAKPSTAVELGLMSGFPPLPDRLVTHDNQLLEPYNPHSAGTRSKLVILKPLYHKGYINSSSNIAFDVDRQIIQFLTLLTLFSTSQRQIVERDRPCLRFPISAIFARESLVSQLVILQELRYITDVSQKMTIAILWYNPYRARVLTDSKNTSSHDRTCGMWASRYRIFFPTSTSRIHPSPFRSGLPDVTIRTRIPGNRLRNVSWSLMRANTASKSPAMCWVTRTFAICKTYLKYECN
jgi:hypothetical protein